jgi:Zn-dependent peptidase ImmA (M78 family)
MELIEYRLDQTLLLDLSTKLEVPDVVEWLEDEAEQLAELGFSSSSGVRFSPNIYAARAIRDLISDTANGEAATITPREDGYAIRFQKSISPDSLRFALAHEIGHTYFFDPRRPGTPLSPLQRSSTGAQTIEHLCNYFAAAFLLPRRHVLRRVGDCVGSGVPPLHMIPVLANEFEVQDQLVARRLMFELFPQRVALLRLRLNQSIRRGGAVQQWRANWCAVPAELRHAHSVAGVRVPLLSSGRLIPDTMIPHLTTNATERCRFDGRWLEGLKPQGMSSARKPFSKRTLPTYVDGYAYQHHIIERASLFDEERMKEVMYLAIPLS